jgi:FtsZ-binding cell division protein ZapB
MLIENKFSKYIIYAIVEIILVVIGILIAPQINTLKEENNNHTRETNYLKSIRNEMQNNLQAFNTEENRISEVIKSKELLLRVMNSTEAIDSISDKTIADLYMFNFNIPINTTIATGAINEIISSGGLQ